VLILGYHVFMETQEALPVKEAEASPSTIHISGRCNYRDEGDIRVIFANAIPLLHYTRADKAAEQYAMIHLVESGLANQEEIAAAFGCLRPTIFKGQKKTCRRRHGRLGPQKDKP